jgi:hypothetical protein
MGEKLVAIRAGSQCASVRKSVRKCFSLSQIVSAGQRQAKAKPTYRDNGYGPKRLRYSVEPMNAFTISA